MRFIVLITLLVLLFVAGFLIFPHVGEWSSVIPRPKPLLNTWIDTNPAPEYNASECTVTSFLTVTNSGDPASDVHVLVTVMDKSSGKIVGSKEVVIGRIKKGEKYHKRVSVSVECAPEGKNVVYDVRSSVKKFS